jgi:hypothetical protein
MPAAESFGCALREKRFKIQMYYDASKIGKALRVKLRGGGGRRRRARRKKHWGMGEGGEEGDVNASTHPHQAPV